MFVLSLRLAGLTGDNTRPPVCISSGIVILPVFHQQNVADHFVFDTGGFCGILEEPDSALDGPIFEGCAGGAERLPQQVAHAGAGRLRVADCLEASAVQMPVGVYDIFAFCHIFGWMVGCYIILSRMPSIVLGG